MSDDISIPHPTYRVPRHRRGMDPATRRLAVIAAAIGGGLVVVVGGWSMIGHHSQGIPVVQAEPGPMRVKPVNRGGLQVQGVNNDIFSGGSDTDVSKLAPPPQTPDPQALRAMEAAEKPAPAPAVAPPATPAPVAAANTLPAPPVARQPAEAAAPVAAPAVKAPEVTAAPAPVRPVDRQASSPAANATPGKSVSVQLAALASEQAAHDEWRRLVRRWPDLFGNRKPSFSKVEHDGHVFWRVRTSGFADISSATVFCERLRVKGAGCSVADF